MFSISFITLAHCISLIYNNYNIEIALIIFIFVGYRLYYFLSLCKQNIHMFIRICFIRGELTCIAIIVHFACQGSLSYDYFIVFYLFSTIIQFLKYSISYFNVIQLQCIQYTNTVVYVYHIILHAINFYSFYSLNTICQFEP